MNNANNFADSHPIRNCHALDLHWASYKKCYKFKNGLNFDFHGNFLCMNFDPSERKEGEPKTFHHVMCGTDVITTRRITKWFVQCEYHAGQLALSSNDSSLDSV